VKRTVLSALAALALAGPIPSLTRADAPADPDPPTLEERIGRDDGYALVLHTSGDIQGNLEVCG
jgi:hypothetical protein